MRGALRVLLLAVVILALGGTLAYWWGSPEVVAVHPPDGANAVQAGSEIRLEFSRTMQPESVIERLEIDPPATGSFTWQGKALVFQPDQPWQAGTTVKVRLNPGARTAGGLSFNLRQGTSWSFQTRQPILAYLYPAGGPANIYTLNPLSGVSTPLTDEAGGVIDFSTDAKGSAIYYSAQHVAGGGSAIYRLDLALDQPLPGNEETLPASTPALLLDCPAAVCRMPSVSPDGGALAYERTGQNDRPAVWLLALQPSDHPDAGNNRQASPRPAGNLEHQTLSPSWSADGHLAYYDSDEAAFIILDLTSGQETVFPNQTGQPGDWHPGGRFFVAPEINFLDTNIAENLQDLQALANSHLLLFDRVEKTLLNLSIDEQLEDASPAFSPDGSYLAFARKFLDTRRWTPGRQIWLLEMPGASGSVRPEATQITNQPEYDHYDLAWNPKGDQIAYVRFNETTPVEPPEIWLLDPFTGRSVRLITAGYAPLWIP